MYYNILITDFMQKEEKAEHQINFNEEDEEKAQQNHISPHIQEYKKFFAKQFYPRDINQITYMLNEHKISYSPNDFSSQISIIKRCQTKHSQAMTLSISISSFNFIINVLNLADQPLSFSLPIIGNGAQGTIHQVCYDAKLFPLQNDEQNFPSDGKLAIKRSDYKDAKELQLKLIEYCYSKFSSALKIGPRIYELFGFDMIISKRYAEFGMEICTRKKVTDESSLKDELFLLHFFRIVHRDIKPQNIMWSQQYKKLVFIDYGFASCWGTQIGYMDKTSFVGTQGFCCAQMKNLFSSNKQNYVDMYFNDMYGLQESLKKMKEQVKKAREKEQNSKQKELYLVTNNKIFNIILQKLIFAKDLEGIKQFRTNHPDNQISAQTILLLREVFPNKVFQQKLIKDEDLRNLNKEKQKILLELRKKYKERIKENFTKLAVESYYVQMNKFFSFQDISHQAQQLKNDLYKKIMSKNYLPQNKYFWKLFLSYICNLFTSEQQASKMFDQVRELIGVNQIKKNECIAMEAWQIIQVVSEKYGHDLLMMNYQLQTENCYNLQKHMIENNFYSKQPYATINSFSFSADLSNDCSSQFYEAYQKQMEQMAHRVKEEVEKKYEDHNEIIVDTFLFFLSNYFNLSNVWSANERAVSRIKGDDFGKKGKLFFEIMKRKNFTNVIRAAANWYQLQGKIRIDNMFYNYSFDYEYLLDFYFSSEILSKAYFNEQIRQLRNAEEIVRSLIKWTHKYLNYRRQMPCFRSFFQYLKFLYDYCHEYTEYRGYLLIIEAIHQILILFYQKFQFVEKLQAFSIFPIKEQHISQNSREAKYNEYYQDLMNNRLNYQFTLNQQICLYRKYLTNKILRQVSSSELISDLQRYETHILQNNSYSKLYLIYRIVSYTFIKNEFSSYIQKLKEYLKLLEGWYQWYVTDGLELHMTDLNSQQACSCALINLYIFCQDSGEKALNFLLTNKFKSIGLKETKRIIQNLFQFIHLHFQHKQDKSKTSILNNKYEIIRFIIQAVKANEQDKILERKINQISVIMEMLTVHIIEQLDQENFKSRIKELIGYENSTVIFCSYIRKYCTRSIWSNLDKLLTVLNRKMFELKCISNSKMARKLQMSRVHQFRKIKSIQSEKMTYILRNQIELQNPMDRNKLTEIKSKKSWYKTKITKIQRKINDYQINKLTPHENFQHFSPMNKASYF